MSSLELFSLVAGLVGGLAMFLYGMNVMSGGLTKAAGGKLESVLAKVTEHPIIAYAFGVAVTAVVQSSSASTVMVVGLVNSGIMTLRQAVNVILGANLGTTFTAWLLSLNAISSDNFFINLLKPKSFTPFLAIIGIGLYMFSKNEKKKNVGTILLGFSVLMFGMSSMSDAVSPLKDVESFKQLLTTFSNPLVGFLVGIIFTMVIQSSAGTIGVLQALSLSVTVGYSIAIPVVVGAEVGTCITAILSSFGANKNGKRTALMHLYFNVIKATLFMIIFYSLHAVIHFDFMDKEIGMAGIAGIHTLINLVATPLMLPFSGILVSLALKTIPIDDKEKKEQEEQEGLRTLDPLFLSNPPFALEQARQTAVTMAKMTKEALDKAIDLITDYHKDTAEEVEYLEQQVDRYEDELGTYLMKINSHHLAPDDSHTLSLLLHCITDYERISDHALNIAEKAKSMDENGRSFSPKAQAEMDIYSTAVRDIVDTSIIAFDNQDVKLAKTIEPLEETIDEIQKEVKRRHVRRLRKGKCTIEQGFDLSDIGTDFERIADHCSNIAVGIIEAHEDNYFAHGYIETLKAEKNDGFEQAVDFYERKYRLPSVKY
ncbi:MAG: Na/Pi cotransporter family protein [Butyrivibrio sp.]|jgi:phosphate:Na+ symporter|uniref:Na/Pi cotransporter family protein n=1 Tax=Butyrivibrio sp. TaxID=28121 RepID=UPI001ECD4768|nr:Na/Pi cotransporter family protein [Butyrivibrio sp.]MBE5840637.1 Na/Pi cotransporter family protein [Butyrivibrio sp.]